MSLIIDRPIHTKHKSQALLAAQAKLKQGVIFNPHDPEHIEAFRMLKSGRQHPTLRFACEPYYADIRQMMLEKIASAFIERGEIR